MALSNEELVAAYEALDERGKERVSTVVGRQQGRTEQRAAAQAAQAAPKQ